MDRITPKLRIIELINELCESDDSLGTLLKNLVRLGEEKRYHWREAYEKEISECLEMRRGRDAH